MEIVLWAIGWLVSLVALYVVIRLAVAHALAPKNTRAEAQAATRQRPSTSWLDADGR